MGALQGDGALANTTPCHVLHRGTPRMPLSFLSPLISTTSCALNPIPLPLKNTCAPRIPPNNNLEPAHKKMTCQPGQPSVHVTHLSSSLEHLSLLLCIRPSVLFSTFMLRSTPNPESLIAPLRINFFFFFFFFFFCGGGGGGGGGFGHQARKFPRAGYVKIIA